MILPRPIDASCRSSNIHCSYSPRSRKKDKTLTNRKYRRNLKRAAKMMKDDDDLWYDMSFKNLRPFTSWEID